VRFATLGDCHCRTLTSAALPRGCRIAPGRRFPRRTGVELFPESASRSSRLPHPRHQGKAGAGNRIRPPFAAEDRIALPGPQ
jgi:hypothetical protein